MSEEKKKVVALYNDGLELYKKREFPAAVAKFEAGLAIDPHDGPSELYRDRCKDLMENPPPADWDGVFTMKTK